MQVLVIFVAAPCLPRATESPAACSVESSIFFLSTAGSFSPIGVFAAFRDRIEWCKMEDKENAKRVVFVTVGTTSFDALVKAVVSQDVKDELHKRGYTHLLIQMGRGIFFPTKCDGADGSLVVDYFTFSSSIADYIRSASLVISHAGSGSIFETLKLGKPLIVVVNEDLMDNHQCELAEALEERKHLYYTRPHTLHQTLMKMELESLVRYTPGDGTPVAHIIDRFLGFPDD